MKIVTGRVELEMMEVKIGENMTVCYKESISGGLFGMIKEIPGCASQGKDLDELILMLLNAKKALELAK